jgi:membrane-bound lytic murein transglycosylase D
MRRLTTVSLIALALLAGCSTQQETLRSSLRPKPVMVDEYSALDDASNGKPMSDLALQKKLEDARRHYLLAMKASERGNVSLASRNFEAAMDILNDLITYPNIYSNSEFTRLSESVVRDYEEQITSIDSLDANSSFFVLRDKIFQEIETIPVERKKYPSPHELAVSAPNSLQIDLTDNVPVQQCIAFFTSEKGRTFFSRWLERSGRFFPVFDKVLNEEGAPQELRYLSMIESGLNPTAVSWAKAVGLWQFIPATAQLYGLQINWWIDERRDPEKATHAAARYLLDLYNDLGDWHLALASYNCGPNRVKSAIAKAGSRDYWKVRDYLPRETQQYVPLFIAASKIAMDPEAYGFTNINFEHPDDYDQIDIKGSFDLPTISQTANLPLDQLQALNPELLRARTPGDATYRLNVPRGTNRGLASRLEQLPPPTQASVNYIQHKVRRGESVAAIAKGYGVDAGAIYEANAMNPRTKLRSGMTLRVPVQNVAAKSTAGKGADSTALAASTAPGSPTPAASPAPAKLTPAPVESTTAQSEPRRPAPQQPAALASTGNSAATQSRPAERAASTPSSSSTTQSSSPLPGPSKGLAAATPPPTPVASVAKPAAPVAKQNTPVARQSQPVVKRPAPKQEITFHKVSRGETLIGIAQQYGVDVNDLKAWNGLGRHATVMRGQKLKIQGVAEKKARQLAARDEQDGKRGRKRAVTTTTTRFETHKVKRGESLAAIADNYGVSVEDLKAWNGKDLKGNKLVAGAKLKVYSESTSKGDARKSSRASRSATKKYSVRRGDTFEDIADRFGVSVKELRKSNPGIKGGKLKPGQSLKIQK